MWMLRTCVKVEVVDDFASKTILREHTLDSHPYKLGRSLLEDLLRCGESLSTRVSGVADLPSVSHLLASEPYFVRIDYDDVVTAVEVRSEGRFVLAAEDKSNSGSKTAEHQVGSINHKPLFLDIASFERYSFVTLCVHLDC